MAVPAPADAPEQILKKPFARPPCKNHHYKFTEEEVRVIQECKKESFFLRSLPLSAILGGGTYYGVRSGFLKRNTRFGAAPKVITAVVIGYFVGKFSYKSKCAERLMQLPDSKIGVMLRQRQDYNKSWFGSFGAFGPGMSLPPFGVADSNLKNQEGEPVKPASDGPSMGPE